MMHSTECPKCGSHRTEVVHTTSDADTIERVRVCGDCVAEFTNKFELFEQALGEGVEP